LCFGIFGLLLFYVVSTSAVLGKTVPEITYYVSRGTLSSCLLTHCVETQVSSMTCRSLVVVRVNKSRIRISWRSSLC